MPDSLIQSDADLIVEVRLSAVELIKGGEKYKYRMYPFLKISDAKNKKYISFPTVWTNNWGPYGADGGSKEDLASHLKVSLENELEKYAKKVCSL